MFPNATRGYMPFVSNQNKGRNNKNGKLNEEFKLQPGKAYQVTLKDRHGFTYSYIVKADGSKSLPVLCDSKMYGRRCGPMSTSMPNMDAKQIPGCNRKSDKSGSDRTDSSINGAKGILTSIMRFLSSKTKTKAKSKRKPKSLPQRCKRQRTISAMSNLDPIQESPDENDERHLGEEEEEDDNDSYLHDSCSSTPESDSIGSGDA
ncbi:Hypothetical predicted protein [Octopus vulgaris]|uniref:Uncharacterized protein n=1 Tax=Octopus vulgaris TaxID=6645 RepID=A0AA36BB07_OCTVU|nr:Hypothetical predicted protein [Octopus vulgaris]